MKINKYLIPISSFSLFEIRDEISHYHEISLLSFNFIKRTRATALIKITWERNFCWLPTAGRFRIKQWEIEVFYSSIWWKNLSKKWKDRPLNWRG